MTSQGHRDAQKRCQPVNWQFRASTGEMKSKLVGCPCELQTYSFRKNLMAYIEDCRDATATSSQCFLLRSGVANGNDCQVDYTGDICRDEILRITLDRLIVSNLVDSIKRQGCNSIGRTIWVVAMRGLSQHCQLADDVIQLSHIPS